MSHVEQRLREIQAVLLDVLDEIRLALNTNPSLVVRAALRKKRARLRALMRRIAA